MPSAADEDVARVGRLARVHQRRATARRDFGVPRIQQLDLRPRLGRLRPSALMLVELGELDPATEKLGLVVEQVGQRLDGGVGCARGFLRVGQQDGAVGSCGCSRTMRRRSGMASEGRSASR